MTRFTLPVSNQAVKNIAEAGARLAGAEAELRVRSEVEARLRKRLTRARRELDAVRAEVKRLRAELDVAASPEHLFGS